MKGALVKVCPVSENGDSQSGAGIWVGGYLFTRQKREVHVIRLAREQWARAGVEFLTDADVPQDFLTRADSYVAAKAALDALASAQVFGAAETALEGAAEGRKYKEAGQ